MSAVGWVGDSPWVLRRLFVVVFCGGLVGSVRSVGGFELVGWGVVEVAVDALGSSGVGVDCA